MFNIGDVVLYSSQGICTIDCIESKQIGKQVADYYVLKPIYNENTAVFVPVNNQMLTAKMQEVLTGEQVQALIKKAPYIEPIYFADEMQKREEYKQILSSNNREKLISLIKTIRLEKDNRRLNNKKLNINDEQTMRKAEMLLYSEVAFVCGVEPDEAKNIILF